jgi:hypothetical protein
MNRIAALREVVWTIGPHVIAGLVITLALFLLAGGGQ